MQTSNTLFPLLLSIITYQSAAANPFAKFIGSWALKDDKWTQRYDGNKTETLTILQHRTKCAPVNTQDSVLCEVSSPGLTGHILWSYDHDTQTVHHLSNFAGQRNGVGVGQLNQSSDLGLKVEFPSEGANTYRDYSYHWDNNNQYSLFSAQFKNGVKTGNFYSGVFVRLAQSDELSQHSEAEQ